MLSVEQNNVFVKYIDIHSQSIIEQYVLNNAISVSEFWSDIVTEYTKNGWIFNFGVSELAGTKIISNKLIVEFEQNMFDTNDNNSYSYINLIIK